MKHISGSVKETNKIAKEFASEVLLQSKNFKKAVVVGLEGELGAGKTTFTKSFAKALGVRETVKSPTFNIMKIYKIKKNSTEKNLIHIDAYRLKSSKDILDLGWKDLITHPSNIILVEWAENIKKALPKPHFLVKISHIKEVERGVDICLSK